MEEAVQTVEGQIRVMKLALEARLGIQVDVGAAAATTGPPDHQETKGK